MATVLIVDDRAENRDFLVNLLGYQDHRILTARNGFEALDLTREERPDLVITDVLMPAMDGYELVRRLRADPATEHTAVVFYTAHFHGPDAESLAQACGVQHVLAKPSERGVVLRTIEKALSGVAEPASSPASGFDEQHLRLITDKLSETVDVLRQTNARLAALVDIDLQLASERNPRRLLRTVCSAARDLIGARYAMLISGKADDDGEAEHITTSGMGPEVAGQPELPLRGHGAVGRAQTLRKPVRMSNPGGDPAAVGLPAWHPRVQALMVAPIVSLSHVYGWICLGDKPGADEFNAEDERLLAILAAQAGRIYESGLLYQEVRDHAQQLQVEAAERKRASEELVESELRFRQLAENINEAFFLVDPRSGHVLYVSPAFETIFGRTCASLQASPRSWLDLVHSDDRERAMAIYDPANARGPFDHEYRIVRPDGAVRWIRVRIFPIRGPNRRVYRVAGVAADITQARNQQEKSKRLTRIKEVRSRINAAIVHIRDHQGLLAEVCRVAVEVGMFKLAWTGVIDTDTRDGRVVAWRGGAEADIEPVRLSARPDSPFRDRPASRAARELRPIVCNDLRLEATAAQKAELARQGHRAMAVFPMVVLGRVHVLALIAGNADFFDHEEIDVLQELVGDVAFGLEHIAKDATPSQVTGYDALTGLPNRMLFYESLKWTISQSREHHWTVSVLLVGLDGFKDVNDTLGQAFADELVRQASQRLGDGLEIRETVWRLGGDRFALVLASPDGHLGFDVDVGNGIREVLRKPFQLHDRKVSITASIGIATCPVDSSDPDTLLEFADGAMHDAKATGGDRLRFHRGEMNVRALEQQQLGEALRDALANDEFELYYQPMVCASSGRWAGVEALLRWNRPGHGLVLPSVFLPIVEGTRLAAPIGAWVVDAACRQMVQWQRAGIDGFRVAVNVSGKAFVLEGLLGSIATALREHAIEPSRLAIEITESSLMMPAGETVAVLRRIKALGVGIAMDDFGTGYSNLACLKRYPIDTLKLDLSVVRDISTDPDAASVAMTVIEMAHGLEMKAIAEGVESREQFELLRASGCDEIQGHYISQPVPADALETLFANTQAVDAPGVV
ncbi:EAL domain-containing protein [Montanilutibacter psychrotolerans]|uniref:EAL domain-containing protein n=1 Tax=Montanilutibacter psychrotolerans TaxID=1327343 RepID=A0A3M8SSV9_9GAMM|nr:EAL domain-containing protein [Lysobacter psychrotolerans]RNF83785.1 EAL domain-containing protein [Lysobacter psychrotolerans]